MDWHLVKNINANICKLIDSICLEEIFPKVLCYCVVVVYDMSGAYAGFLKGGPNFKISVILDMSQAAKLRAFARGGLEACPPKKIFLNGAISCVLKAIPNHFQGKNSLKKL